MRSSKFITFIYYFQKVIILEWKTHWNIVTYFEILNDKYIFYDATAPSRAGPPHYRGFTITLKLSISVGLLWTIDQPHTGICT